MSPLKLFRLGCRPNGKRCAAASLIWPGFLPAPFLRQGAWKLQKINTLFVLSENLTSIHSRCILHVELGLERES